MFTETWLRWRRSAYQQMRMREAYLKRWVAFGTLWSQKDEERLSDSVLEDLENEFGPMVRVNLRPDELSESILSPEPLVALLERDIEFNPRPPLGATTISLPKAKEPPSPNHLQYSPRQVDDFFTKRAPQIIAEQRARAKELAVAGRRTGPQQAETRPPEPKPSKNVRKLPARADPAVWAKEALPKEESPPSHVRTVSMDSWTTLNHYRKLEEEDKEDFPWEALEAARSKRNSEVEAVLPHPECCPEAKRIYAFRRIDSDGHEDVVVDGGRPQWKSVFDEQYRGQTRSSAVIHFCPFCGTKLPELQKKENPPPYLVIEDGNWSCGRCDERFNHCFCTPPEGEWEIIK